MAFPTLETNRLNLIQLNDKYLDDLFEIYRDEETMKYWDEFPHKELAETKKLLELLTDRYKNSTGICWGIALKNNNREHPEIIGTISYNRYFENGIGVIGYILNKKYWNKGLMTEAMTEFIKFGFDRLKVHRIEAHVTPGNIVSEKVLLKLQFKKEGLLREREFYKGEHQSIIMYGKLKTDK